MCTELNVYCYVSFGPFLIVLWQLLWRIFTFLRQILHFGLVLVPKNTDTALWLGLDTAASSGYVRYCTFPWFHLFCTDTALCLGFTVFFLHGQQN